MKAATAAVRKVEDWLDTPAARLRQDYQAIFGGPTGERVLADLFKRARIGNSSAVVGDSHMTYFFEGRRDVALHIQNQLSMSDADAVRLAQRRADDGD